MGKGLDDCLKVFASVAIEQPRNVFQHNPAGFKAIHDVERIKEQARALACQSAPFACNGNVLAGEAADDDINGRQVGQAGSHVGKLLCGWEVVGEHGAAGVGDFNLPFCAETCLLKIKMGFRLPESG